MPTILRAEAQRSRNGMTRTASMRTIIRTTICTRQLSTTPRMMTRRRPPSRAPAPAPGFSDPRRADTLLSSAANASVSDAFTRLGSTIMPTQPQTLEDLMKDLLRPMLKLAGREPSRPRRASRSGRDRADLPPPLRRVAVDAADPARSVSDRRMMSGASGERQRLSVEP